MATFLPLGTGFYQATNPRNPKDINITTLLAAAVSDATAAAAAGSPTISSGIVAPASTPAKIGDIYVDTVAKKLYFASGIASAADWTITN